MSAPIKSCVECDVKVNLSVDNYTLYQVDGAHYLYCEKCKNPREPYISLAEETQLKEQIILSKNRLKRTHISYLFLFLIGFITIWFMGSSE